MSSLIAQGRPPGRPYRIAITAQAGPDFDRLLADQMKALGWSAGKDYVALVPKGLVPSFDHIDQNIVLGLNERPDVLVVGSTAGAVVAQKRNKEIPVVMLGSGYPVEAGVADSLARPGRNVTGNSIYAGTGVWGKMLELLRESKPGIKRVVLLWGYAPPAFPRAEIEPCYEEFRRAAAALGLSLRIIEITSQERLAEAVKEAGAAGADALFVSGWLTTRPSWPKVIEFAKMGRLPIISDYVTAADPGPMLVYSPDPIALWKAAIGYIDRILRGAKPGELPIQLPTRFELTVNLKTARAVGITIPPSLLLRAGRVIE